MTKIAKLCKSHVCNPCGYIHTNGEPYFKDLGRNKIGSASHSI